MSTDANDFAIAQCKRTLTPQGIPVCSDKSSQIHEGILCLNLIVHMEKDIGSQCSFRLNIVTIFSSFHIDWSRMQM